MQEVPEQYPLKYYSPREEKVNILTHAIGIFFGMFALLLMLLKNTTAINGIQLFATIIYGTSIITLFTASTLFHSSKEPKLRYRLNIFDHSSIFLLIAGTYTPYTLITLSEKVGWVIFIVVWGIALSGILLKLFFTGRYRVLSTVLYVAMGWIIVFAFKPLYNKLDFQGIIWLIAGGVTYTLGAALYAVKKIPYNHAIFHAFVLLAAICHFISIYFYVL